MIPFNLPDCLLEGVNLIEASAGTGKTHALAGLYLRLIIEKKLVPQQILVITYTKAATAELKRRIRKILQDAGHSFSSGRAADSFYQSLLKKHESTVERENIARQISLTLADFDEAAIYTIHGFCQRILTENAFESGSSFDTEIITDQQRLEQEFVEDFWRRNFYMTHPAIVKFALFHGIDKNYFLALLRSTIARPNIKVIPAVEPLLPDDFDWLVHKLEAIFSSFKTMWIGQRREIIECLHDEALNGRIYGKNVENLAAKIDKFVFNREPSIPVVDGLNKISQSYLQEKTNKYGTTPEHPAFITAQDLCAQTQEIENRLNTYILGLKKKFLDSLQSDFPQLKQKYNILFFDDLLLRADAALHGKGGLQLAAILGEKYPAVLIDEFQDTDPLQFAIIQTIFLPAKTNKSGNIVFYIGDPKQAIYSFRGADIFAYLRAAASVDHRYTMTQNWRSQAELINAINILFKTPSRPFVFNEIQYAPTGQAPDVRIPKLRIDDENQAALQWWFLPSGEDNKPTAITRAREYITQAVVHEIANLLAAGRAGKALIGDKSVSERDIAILVRKNSEAALMQKVLGAAGISSVLYSTESVFVSGEAEELKRFISGLINQEDEGYLLAALATSFFSLTARDLAACNEDENMLELWRYKFREYHDLWLSKGFLVMFCSFLDREHIRSRIVSRPHGERRLTNYLHLAQLLHQYQIKGNLSMAEALSWLDMMRRKEEMAAENEQLRLETDQNCIRLVTIHKSKGLEYPIVFCPFAWEGTNQDKEALPLCFHDEQSNWQLTGDLGSSAIDVNKEQYKREILAENCRLLYVALTRAKNRCYFAWGKIRNTKDSAAAYLFHRRHLSAISDWDRLNDEEMLADLSSFIQQAPGDIRLTKIGATSPPAPLPQREEAEKLLAREFKGSIDHTWKIASFTYLASVHKPHAEEITQGDEDYESGQTAISRTILQNTDSMLTFPHGTLSGIMLHEILEKLDFAIINDIDLKAIIAEKLIKYDFNLVWQPVIIELLKQLVKLPLGRSGIDEFSLSRLGADRCLREVEFYFPLSEITAGKIIEVLERSGIYTDNDRRINDLYGKLNFPPTRGYLRGFIDLVCEFQGRFYLMDWKSNYLGDNFEQYSPGSLKKVMSASSYILQYLIYTVALNKYLQRRMKNYSYEKNFGGVYYIFLRGVNSQIAGGNGIYFDLPDYNVVRQMDKLMLDHR